MSNLLTLGSLFDGFGGFPLAGLLSGITPVWSSEIEPFHTKGIVRALRQTVIADAKAPGIFSFIDIFS